MKRDCSTCIYKKGSCYPSKTIFDKDKTCYSYNPDYEGYVSELEKENERLTVSYETIKLHDEEEIGMLKSENAELKGRNAELKGMYAHSAREAETYKQFLELKEKENVELNETLGKCAKMPVLYCLGAKETIAKAKEIIKMFVNECKMCRAYPEAKKMWYQEIAEAEQFLKDSEVEK